MVNKARSRYYWSWGATWIAAILAWGVNGIFSGYNDVLMRSPSEEFWDTTSRWYYINNGSMILLGGVAAYNIYQLTRYLYTSTQGAAKTAKQEKK
jgi:hypothetical protein